MGQPWESQGIRMEVEKGNTVRYGVNHGTHSAVFHSYVECGTTSQGPEDLMLEGDSWAAGRKALQPTKTWVWSENEPFTPG